MNVFIEACRLQEEITALDCASAAVANLILCLEKAESSLISRAELIRTNLPSERLAKWKRLQEIWPKP